MDPSDVIDSIFQVHRSRCRSHSEGHRRRVAPSQKAGADADVRSGRSRTGLEYSLFLPIFQRMTILFFKQIKNL